MFSQLKTWWQLRTGEDETPLDGDGPAWLASIAIHLLLLLTIGWLVMPTATRSSTLTLTPTFDDMLDQPIETRAFEVDDLPPDDIGSDSLAADDAALSVAMDLSDVLNTASPEPPVPFADPIDFQPAPVITTGSTVSENLVVKGIAGVGTTGASGAIDRLTQEILLSMEERPTLVVWLFDQSASLIRQRQDLQERFGRIYDELDHVTSAQQPTKAEPPLISTIVQFGRTTKELTQPTDDPEVLRQAVKSIERDDSGIENVFHAIYQSLTKYRRMRTHRQRNVMLVVFTDEVGDDADRLNHCVRICQQSAIPVYVVGIPAPFGRREAVVKWVDPDPGYDQSPQLGRVDQGPESLILERIDLPLPGFGDDDPILDSGFGPFALTRLAYESGGIYFAVHPNRQPGRNIRGSATVAYSSYIQRFFDTDVMRRYRPDYVPADVYQRQLKAHPSRWALVQAAQIASPPSISMQQRRFVKRDEASFAQQVTEAQKAAAVNLPWVDQLVSLLEQGETARATETSPRWQAGFDLAYGRALATKVRTSGYNMMLAKAKRGLKYKDENNNTWVLRKTNHIDDASQSKHDADKAIQYLQRVIDEHPETPWAYVASLELDQPMGWQWTERFTEQKPPSDGRPTARRNRPPRDDRPRQIAPQLPKRPLPKL